MKKPCIHLTLVTGAAALAMLALAGCGGGQKAEAPAPKAAEKPAAPAAAPAATEAAPAAAPAATDAAAAPAAAPATDAAPIGEEAKTVFNTRCATCHGTSGHGDGPASAALNPKPRSYADVAWQDSVTDEHIAKTIVEGGAAVGKSPLMAPNPDLASKPEVVKDLVRIVRSFKGAP